MRFLIARAITETVTPEFVDAETDPENPVTTYGAPYTERRPDLGDYKGRWEAFEFGSRNRDIFLVAIRENAPIPDGTLNLGTDPSQTLGPVAARRLCRALGIGEAAETWAVGKTIGRVLFTYHQVSGGTAFKATKRSRKYRLRLAGQTLFEQNEISGGAISNVDFESASGYTDGNTLASNANWAVYQISGSGVPTIDTHTDHKSGQVVDNSTVGQTLSIHQTALSSSDMEVGVTAFTDHPSYGVERIGVAGRLNSATPSATTTGYMFDVEAGIASYQYGYQGWSIRRIDSDGSTTILASDSDDDTSIPETWPVWAPVDIKGEIDGSSLTMYLDDVEVLSTTDTTHSTGTYSGVWFERNIAETGGQPFFDDFYADEIGGGGSTVNVTAESQFGAITATALTTVTSPPVEVIANGAFGALTGTASSSVENLVIAASAFGSLTATASTTAFSLVNVTAEGAFGDLTATALSTTLSLIDVTAASAFGDLTATATTGVENFVTAASLFGALTATASSDTLSLIDVTAESLFGALTATASSNVAGSATAESVFTFAGTAQSDVEHFSTAAVSLGDLTATALTTGFTLIDVTAASAFTFAASADAQIEGATSGEAVFTFDAAASADVEVFATASEAFTTQIEASSDVAHDVTASASLGALTATADVTVTGTGSAIADGPFGDLTGEATTVRSTSATAEGSFALSATANAQIAGTVSAEGLLGDLSATATPVVSKTATASEAFTFTAEAQAAPTRSVTASASFGDLTATAQATTAPVVTASGPFGDLTVTAQTLVTHSIALEALWTFGGEAIPVVSKTATATASWSLTGSALSVRELFASMESLGWTLTGTGSSLSGVIVTIYSEWATSPAEPRGTYIHE